MKQLTNADANSTVDQVAVGAVAPSMAELEQRYSFILVAWRVASESLLC